MFAALTSALKAPALKQNLVCPYSTATVNAGRSIIPPNLITTTSATTTPGTAANLDQSSAIQSLVRLYRGLPKGVPKTNPANYHQGFIVNYRNKHFTPGNESAKPVLHAILVVFVIGYSIQYNFHLKHHKNKLHH